MKIEENLRCGGGIQRHKGVYIIYREVKRYIATYYFIFYTEI